MNWDNKLPILIAATVGLLLLQLLVVVKRNRRNNALWSKLDTVNVSSSGGIISWAIAILRSIVSMQEMMDSGYRQFSKANKPFALPTMWMGGAVVVLPSSMLHLLNRPRDELASFPALLENAQFKYLMTDKDVWGNAIHFDIVRKNLGPRDIADLTGVMAKEWDAAFRIYWGDSNNGRVVNAWDSMMRVIARVSLRIMVGEPGCKDEKYLEQSRLYANAVLVDACMIKCMPPSLRSVVGRLLALRARYHQRKLLIILVPIVERMRQYDKNEGQNNHSVRRIQVFARSRVLHLRYLG